MVQTKCYRRRRSTKPAGVDRKGENVCQEESRWCAPVGCWSLGQDKQSEACVGSRELSMGQ